MSFIKGLLPMIRLAIATLLISIGVLLLAWAFSRPIDFGEGVLGWIQKFGFLWLLVGSWSLGIVLLAYEKGVTGKKLAEMFLVCFGGIHAGLGIASMALGVPLDASYSFGINAIMIASAIIVLLPSITIIMAIITIYIVKTEDFWFAIFKILFIAALMVLYALVVIPNVMALI